MANDPQERVGGVEHPAVLDTPVSLVSLRSRQESDQAARTDAGIAMRGLASELLADARSTKLLAALSTGLIVAALTVVFAPTLATIVFSGPMAPFVGRGTGTILFGSVILCLITALTGSYRGSVSIPVFGPAAVLFTIGGEVAVRMSGASGEALFATMLVIVVLSTLGTGLCFLFIARFRLAGFCHFMPYPVIGGFLAGLGGLLFLSSVNVISGMPLSWETIPRLLETDMVLKWAPSMVYALGLLVATRLWSNMLIVPASGLLAVLICHAALFVLGISMEEARASGILYVGVPSGATWPPLGWGDFAGVDWGVVGSQLPGILGVVLVTLMSIVLNTRALEVAIGADFDLDREFRAGGLACLAAGVGGSPPGCNATTLCLISHATGAKTRLTGIFAAVIMGSVLVTNGDLLAILPSSLLGGLVLYVAFSVLYDWLLPTRNTMPRIDYCIILVISFVIWYVGIPEGVGVGLAAAVLIFVARFSGMNVISASFTAREHRSKRVRSTVHRAILGVWGERARAFRLRGHIIFGNAAPMGNCLKQALRTSPAPLCLLLDFSAVSGFDVSAAHVILRCLGATREAGARLVLSGVPESVRCILRRCFPEEEWRDILFEENLDCGLERCEDLLIGEWDRQQGGSEAVRNALLDLSFDRTLRDLSRQARFEELTARLGPWLEERVYAKGEIIAARGENQQGMQLLMEGRVTECDGLAETRIDEFGEGDSLVTAAVFEAHVPQTSLAAERSCRTALLTRSARRSLERELPALAVALDRYIMEAFLEHRVLRPPVPAH